MIPVLAEGDIIFAGIIDPGYNKQQQRLDTRATLS
jgi:hypothetical protein